MKIRTWKNVMREGFLNVFRNRVMSLASVCAITAALFVLGLVLAAVFNLNYIVSGLESTVEITVFVRDGASSSEISLMEQEMRSWEGVTSLEFISNEQALENWREEWGDRSHLLDGYGRDNNPLPNSFRIMVERPEYVEDIVDQAGRLRQAEMVQYSKDVVDTIIGLVDATRLIGLTVVVVLMIMAMIIINNTIKITVYSRRREINIMKYIGATDWYVRWPFVIEGFVLGLIGAVAAGGFTAGVYRLLLNRSSDVVVQDSFLSVFHLMPMAEIIYSILMIFFIAGSLVGLCAGLLSVHRHLKV